ncbi:hypothetical protein BZM27_23880 [Paraburkholderia steynii]|uniref:HTH araC/xylS-type domain-containing protein n=1 Tax=Paraburkholderia steynii TaxID=1245441 RepID=A0A4R0X949_9BURK|nr:hypothetical protein BZM27_23880 [Paraburkholderia steynii]
MERAIPLPSKRDESSSALTCAPKGCSSRELAAIEKARGLMLATLGSALSIDIIAASVQMSKGHFSRLFKRATGATPHSWRLEKKVRSSLVDLRNDDLSLTQIAHAYGFADHAHYSRVFKQVVGTPPSVWRITALSGEGLKSTELTGKQ